MKSALGGLIVLTFISLTGFAKEADLKANLDDLMSPDELAAEVGQPRTEMSIRINSLDDLYHFEGINVFSEYALVLVINKNSEGPGAQTMRVYENGVVSNEWPISTGRERQEVAKSGRRYFSVTPLGWFQPKTITRSHYSKTWQTDMEFAVFFNGGIAIHATTPYYYKELGTRASGGCVRLKKENAEYVYNKILKEGKGLVPAIGGAGTVSRDRRGQIIRSIKWKTLIAVVDR